MFKEICKKSITALFTIAAREKKQKQKETSEMFIHRIKSNEMMIILWLSFSLP